MTALDNWVERIALTAESSEKLAEQENEEMATLKEEER